MNETAQKSTKKTYRSKTHHAQQAERLTGPLGVESSVEKEMCVSNCVLL